MVEFDYAKVLFFLVFVIRLVSKPMVFDRRSVIGVNRVVVVLPNIKEAFSD